MRSTRSRDRPGITFFGSIPVRSVGLGRFVVACYWNVVACYWKLAACKTLGIPRLKQQAWMLLEARLG